MESIIYDYYGYNFKKTDVGYYDYLGYKFMFLAINEDENTLNNMQQIISKVSYVFDNKNHLNILYHHQESFYDLALIPEQVL